MSARPRKRRRRPDHISKKLDHGSTEPFRTSNGETTSFLNRFLGIPLRTFAPEKNWEGAPPHGAVLISAQQMCVFFEKAEKCSAERKEDDNEERL
ncbi:uncharacterized protein L3040_004704 [Drepanopeziza brunnea f. sp. 'multigermtubi']|uniref:uncharacterized protein n=1 Tax=Drepanopeziza brunnea f. sp. 'multigermtubi' TaxID=698441 RepID=UPI002383D1E5|nr:hypothetical protein L3040_004704 [Drepanopeziza brunnea f. sp. 'multigermtubi']